MTSTPAVALALVVACRPDGPAPAWPPPQTTPSTPTTASVAVWEGPWPDALFGQAVAERGDVAAVGAPGAGQVFLLGAEGSVSAFGDADAAGHLGSAVAVADHGVVVAGAPLAHDGEGELVLPAAAVRTADPALGARVRSVGRRLLATTSSGLWDGDVDGTGQEHPLPSRPGDVAIWRGQRVAGLPWGPHALSVADRLLERVGSQDEAGYALCAADLDGDGLEDLAVGAPAAGLVHVLTGDPAGASLADAVTFGPGQGRFGHALACQGGVLLVGAPLYGVEAAGAVFVLTGLALPDAPTWWGERGGEAFGWALSVDGGGALVGAPGEAGAPGRVIRLPLP